MLTYGDGVGNIDLKKLLEFHQKHGKLATVTAVRPPQKHTGLLAQAQVDRLHIDGANQAS